MTSPAGPRPPMPPPAVPPRGDFEAVLETRREQGAAMEPALVDSFASKIVSEVARQQHYLAQQAPPKPPSSGPALTLGLISVVMMVPLTAIALGTGFPWVLMVIAPTLALINIAFAWGQRLREQDVDGGRR